MNFWLVELSDFLSESHRPRGKPSLSNSWWIVRATRRAGSLALKMCPYAPGNFSAGKTEVEKVDRKKMKWYWYMIKPMIKPDWLNHRMMRSHYQLLVGHLFVKCWDGWGWMPCPRMYMSQEKHVTHNDFEEIKEKVDWVEIHGAAAVTRKTMWFVKEGCRRAMAGRAEVGKKSLRVLWGTQSRMPRDCIRAWMSNRDAIGYHRVVECCWCLLYMASLLSFSIYFAHVQHCACFT